MENKNYSCPYEYIRKKVEVRISRNIVEIFFSGTRIASHPRLHGPFPQIQHSPWTHACVEDIKYTPSRHLDKGQIARLSSCNYILECNNVIILGSTGTGKSYISCALGVAANRNFYSAKYIRITDLFSELAIARGEGNYQKVIKEYKAIKLLILDDWLLLKLNDTIADAICGWIVHNAYTIVLEGESLCKIKKVSDPDIISID